MSWKSLELNPLCLHFYYIDTVHDKSSICPFEESKRTIFEIKSELCCRYLHFKERKPIFFKLLLVQKRQILFFSAPNLLQVLKDIKSLERAILALRQKLERKTLHKFSKNLFLKVEGEGGGNFAFGWVDSTQDFSSFQSLHFFYHLFFF